MQLGDAQPQSVLAYRRSSNETLLVLNNNLASEPQGVQMLLAEHAGAAPPRHPEGGTAAGDRQDPVYVHAEALRLPLAAAVRFGFRHYRPLWALLPQRGNDASEVFSTLSSLESLPGGLPTAGHLVRGAFFHAAESNTCLYTNAYANGDANARSCSQ